MSGGHYDYIQYRLHDLVDTIKEDIRHHAEDPNYGQFPPEILLDMHILHDKLQEATIRLNRLDWLISGDDGIDAYHARLKDDLERFTGKKYKP